MNNEDFTVAAQEMAMHVSLCVCAEYIASWGMAEFLFKLEEYSNHPSISELYSYADKLESGGCDE